MFKLSKHLKISTSLLSVLFLTMVFLTGCSWKSEPTRLEKSYFKVTEFTKENKTIIFEYEHDFIDEAYFTNYTKDWCEDYGMMYSINEKIVLTNKLSHISYSCINNTPKHIVEKE